MITEKAPISPAPWPPLRSNDKLQRYPKPYRIGQKKGESFATIARQHGVGASELLAYNFRTRNPEEINWYLAHYLGCPKPKPHQANYTFEGATYDEAKRTGMIFLPTFGEPQSDHSNRLGEKVAENYSLALRKEPGGLCYATCYARVKEASRQVGVTLPTLDSTSDFGRLWASIIEPKSSWLKLPEEYRGKGAAGALENEGLGTLVDARGIWSGGLEPGAVVQTWRVAGDYANVRDGVAPTSYGHSFLFMHYVRSGSGITAIVMADQGFQNDDPLVMGEYGYWANLTKSL